VGAVPRATGQPHKKAIYITQKDSHAVSHHADLVCFRGADAFPENDLTFDAIAINGLISEARAALASTRYCDKYCHYQRGHDPIEHFMDRRLSLLEESNRRLQWIAIWIAAILGAAQVIVAIIGLYAPTSPKAPVPPAPAPQSDPLL
jgi:hypothetical protein